MTQVFYRAPIKSYPTVSHGSGIYLWDTEGQRYLDGSSGALVVNVGHGRQEIAEAMARQASRVAFAHTMRFTSEAQETLGSLIAERLQPEPYYTYLVSGGSEATETAVKLARQYHLERGEPQRVKVMAKWASYHGNTLGALALSGHLSRRRPYAPLLAESVFPHFMGPTNQHGYGEACDCLSLVEARLEQEGPQTIAALVIEVVGGSALSGFVPHRGYLSGLEALCRKHGILFIVDEVMTGMGRTGDWWAHTREGLRPDMMTLAKGLSSGYSPLGAVVAHKEVWETIRSGSGTFAHGITYGGNPVSAAAGVSVMKLLGHEQLPENATLRGQYLARRLGEMAANYPVIREVRGLGLMQALVLRTDTMRAGSVATTLVEDAFDHGLIIYPGNGSPTSVFGDHVLVAPPLIITDDEIDELLGILAQSLQRLQDTVR